MSADSIVGDGLAQSPYEELREEMEHSLDARSLAISTKALDYLWYLNAQLRAERDSARARLTEIVQWLEREQPDVFRRGLWDAIKAQEGGR